MPKAKSTVFPGRPKIVYLAHPVRGNVSQNVQSILKLCDEIHSEETIPFAPYLQYLQYLDDAVEADRQKGILAEKPFFVRKAMDEVWLCGDRISEGMKLEIEWSLELGIPIKCHNPLLEPELEKILEKNKKK